MLGRGIVDPVDLHHPLNPAAHPALLTMLASDFVAMKYDIRAFLRELALTRTYQLALNTPNAETFYTPGVAGCTDYPALVA